MKNITENPLSTFIGIAFIALAISLLFIDTIYSPLPLWALGIIAVAGLLLLFAKDKFISIITLGLDRFLKK